MNSNINLDINSYLSEELEKLVGLKESYDRNNLFDKIKVIKEDINNSNLSETKRNDFNIFLDNIYAKLTNKLLNNSNGNEISQYDSEHFLIKRPENKKSIDESTTLESNKKIGKSIIKKSYTIDSLYRGDYSNITNTSSNFVIDLPETITNAVTLSISSLEIPITYHNISIKLNNNVFNIEVYDKLNSSDPTAERTKLLDESIQLIPGLYEARFTSSAHFKAADIKTEIRARIFNKFDIIAKDTDNHTIDIRNLAADIRDNLSYNVNLQSGLSIFTYDNSSALVLKLQDDYLIKINWNVDNNSALSVCNNNYLYQKLGWGLGYTVETITFTENDLANSDGEIIGSTIVQKLSQNICSLNYPRYLYIAIDDFQTSSRNYFSIAAPSIMAPNIIGRINIQSVFEEKTAYKSGAVAGDYLFSQKNVREYFGPTNIKKLKVSLLDQYGRVFELNNSDWSFIASFECLYNY